MIISSTTGFIFFKPIKTAGTSVEIALTRFCGEEDIITGSVILDEIDSVDYDISPRNNWKSQRVISGKEALEYLKKNGREDLWEKGYKKLNLCDGIIYEEHTSPLDLSKKGFNTSEFKTISMVRNPFDLLVSYFWWSFNVPVSSVATFSQQKQEEILKKQKSWMAPTSQDSVKDLKYKFESFLNLPANFSGYSRPSDTEKTVLQWFSDWSGEFFLADLDYLIRFENLSQDFKRVCNEISPKETSLPHFKGSQRKSSVRYSQYYTKSMKDTVELYFQETLEKFKYKFDN